MGKNISIICRNKQHARLAIISAPEELCKAMQRRPIRLDARGHQMPKMEPDTLWGFARDISAESLRALVRAIRSKKRLAAPVSLGSNSLHQCSVCGKNPEVVTDGIEFYAKAPCPHPNGIRLLFELNVPSGVMVVANDLRPHFDTKDSYDINTVFGCVQKTKAMAKIGCAHAYVGNTCPGMYRTGKDRFTIAASGFKDDNEIGPDGELVASIVTDLWWYSIVDADDYDRRDCTDKYAVERVEVRPGVYRFTHFAHLKTWKEETDRPTIYTNIRWVRKPDPTVKPLAGKQLLTSLREELGEKSQWVAYVIALARSLN